MTDEVRHAREQLDRLLYGEDRAQGCVLLVALAEDPAMRVIVEEMAEGAHVTDVGQLVPGDVGTTLAVQVLRALGRLDDVETLALGPIPGRASLRSVAPVDLDFVFPALAGLEALRSLTLYQLSDSPHVIAPVDLPGLERLVITRGPSVRTLDLTGAPGLQECEIHQARWLHDLDLSGLAHLRVLHIDWGRKLVNLDSLSGLKRLEKLSLSGGLFTSQERIPGTPMGSGCSALTSVDGIAGLPRLAALELSWCEVLEDIGPLVSLPALEVLDLSGCLALTSFEPLSRLGRLKHLRLTHCPTLEDLGVLAGLETLSVLCVGNCDALRDLDGLRGLSNLQEVHIWECGELADVSALADLPNLSALTLGGSRHIPRPLRGKHPDREAVAAMQEQLRALS
jgi:hypothetical protein